MKQNIKWIFIFGITLFISLCVPIFVQADPGDPPCVGPDPQTGECPIDSGLLILIAIGVGYGIKKVTDSRKAPVME